jgi:cytochrome P450
MEAKVAFRTLLNSYDELSLADTEDNIHWRPGMMMRSLEKLRIALK